MKIKDAATIIFLLLTILLALSIIGPTENFANFYRAIEEMQLTATVTPEQNATILDLKIKIMNNSSYVGLELSLLYYELSFEANGNIEKLIDGGSHGPPKPLDPYKNITCVEDRRELSIDNVSTMLLRQLLQENQDINWMLMCNILLSTPYQTLRIDDLSVPVYKY